MRGFVQATSTNVERPGRSRPAKEGQQVRDTKRSRLLIVMTLLVAALTIVAAGCGGDDDDEAAPTTTGETGTTPGGDQGGAIKVAIMTDCKGAFGFGYELDIGGAQAALYEYAGA